VYEKRLIEAYISENRTEPTTGEPLTTDDLIDLQTARIVRPRPPQHTSVPALLHLFQAEWDALALETYTLKETLVKTRRDLSSALYQNDGAIALIAKYKKERDEARDALAKVNVGSRSTAGGADAMQIDAAPLSASVIAKVDATQAELSKTRRKRPLPEDWATSEQISKYTATSTSEPLYPGGRTLALQDDLALVGGSDGIAGVYSLSNQKVSQALKGGGGAITDGLWAGSKAVISTASGKIKVFEAQQEVASFSVHAGEASGLALHPGGDILASVGVDKSYVLYDLDTNEVLTQIYSNSGWSIRSPKHTDKLTRFRSYLRQIPSGWSPVRSWCY
jgi:pre-mRNA-processing factor 19